MTRPSPVTSFVWTDTFRRDYKRLAPALQERVKEALERLLDNPVPPGLRLEKLAGHDLYTIHVTPNHSHKLSFGLEGGIAVLRRVRTHKEIDRAP